MDTRLLFWKRSDGGLVLGDKPEYYDKHNAWLPSGLTFHIPVDSEVGLQFGWHDIPKIRTDWLPEGLVFRHPIGEAGTLIFGWVEGEEVDAPDEPTYDVTIDAQFRESNPELTLRVVPVLACDAEFEDTETVTIRYASNTARPTVHETVQCHQNAVPEGSGVRHEHHVARKQPLGTQQCYQQADPLSAQIAHKLPDRWKPSRWHREHVHENATSVSSVAEHLFEQGSPIQGWRQTCHDQATPLSTFLKDLWQERVRRRWAGEQLHQDATPVEAIVGHLHQDGTPLWVNQRSCYQWANVLPVGARGEFKPPPDGWICHDPNKLGILVFEPDHVGLNGELLFVCDKTYVGEDGTPVYPDAEKPAQIIIPVRKVYHVMNEVKVFKAESGTELPVQSISLDLDMASWAWGFNMKLPLSVLPDVMATNFGEPVELLASVNGSEFLLLAEKVTRSRMFGKTFVELSGRGHSAYLAAPYSPVLNHSIPTQKTAQQLTRDILTTNGVSIGWDINWGITDWLVPAGSWSAQGTYMDGVRDIAKAVGAFVLPHRTEKELTIKPQYPHLPWNWGSVSPEIEIQTDVIETESVQWRESPEYNSVYVTGVSQGVVGWVRKGGTAGGLQAPMKTHGLITHADAARMAGSAILSDTGRMAIIKLSLPVLPETGIIDPGQMVRYTEGGQTIMGLTRAVQVSMREMPKLRQTIEVVTYV